MGSIQFSSLGEFLEMGRYTFHVWAVYAIFAAFLLINLLQPLRQRRAFIREQKQRIRRDRAPDLTAAAAVSEVKGDV
jgi:heme exporter protein D